MNAKPGLFLAAITRLATILLDLLNACAKKDTTEVNQLALVREFSKQCYEVLI